jgi:hypothetical protein
MNAIVTSSQAKEGMPNPERLVSNSLKNDVTITIFVLKLTLPHHRTVFPNPMHTINAPKRARKPLIYVDPHLLFNVIMSRLSQVCR